MQELCSVCFNVPSPIAFRRPHQRSSAPLTPTMQLIERKTFRQTDVHVCSCFQYPSVLIRPRRLEYSSCGACMHEHGNSSLDLLKGAGTDLCLPLAEHRLRCVARVKRRASSVLVRLSVATGMICAVADSESIHPHPLLSLVEPLHLELLLADWAHRVRAVVRNRDPFQLGSLRGCARCCSI